METTDQIRVDIIEDFLKLFEGALFPEHLTSIEAYLTKLTNLMLGGYATSTYGAHYKKCIWSNSYAENGPDTCSCISLDIQYRDIIKIINLYRRFKNLKEIKKF